MKHLLKGWTSFRGFSPALLHYLDACQGGYLRSYVWPTEGRGLLHFLYNFCGKEKNGKHIVRWKVLIWAKDMDLFICPCLASSVVTLSPQHPVSVPNGAGGFCFSLSGVFWFKEDSSAFLSLEKQVMSNKVAGWGKDVWQMDVRACRLVFNEIASDSLH